ncbi:SDR family NAD(P)-dependent oxidoreductase [Streptomyces tendae]|uniref:SDR family NAD(P)-dependent oxidoreductase n=1 Tax=Streptomyces tendae TaxID=1932 RepID=UPI003F4B37AC
MDGSGPLAPVTVASSGNGCALAALFAEHGHDVVVNAEDERLEHAAQRLRETGVAVRAVRADPRTAEGVDQLVVTLTGLAVDVAELNAGVGQGGSLVDTEHGDARSGRSPIPSPEGPLVGGSLPVERCPGTGSPHRRDPL